jgi:pimeloyl-ACP methyl ester carboxylesterase
MFTPTASRCDARARFVRAAVALAATAALAICCSHFACAAPGRGSTTPKSVTPGSVRILKIHYVTHNGRDRTATVLLPASYGSHDNPLPLVISPHGRGATGESNADFFGHLPAIGHFAVVSPDGMGRRTRRFSYGYAGQIDDLAKLPAAVTRALPWVRIDRTRIYALGSSMGGQETALLVARHPHLLAGAAAMDSVTDLSRRYHQLAEMPCDKSCLAKWGMPRGRNLQSVMRREVGGTPETNPRAYASRSALSLAAAIAASGVPLQIWWSSADKIVIDQRHQSDALYREIRRLNPCAAVSAYAGRWAHSTEMRAQSLLPIALAGFGLLRDGYRALPRSVRYQPAPCGDDGRKTLGK